MISINGVVVEQNDGETDPKQSPQEMWNKIILSSVATGVKDLTKSVKTKPSPTKK